jgi:hypothetical protein
MTVSNAQPFDPSDDVPDFDPDGGDASAIASQTAPQAAAGLAPSGGVAAPAGPDLAAIETALARVPKQTRAASGLPGDPINFAFVGTADQLAQSLGGTGWTKADQSFGSDLEYAGDVITHRTDKDAPVSNLTLMGRNQDMAFEQTEGPDKRHHLRVWQAGTTPDGTPIWVGAATHDIGITAKKNYFQALGEGIEHGHFDIGMLLPTTHQIDSNIDAERQKVVGDFQSAGNTVLGSISGFGKTRGTNGDGTTFTTDGQMAVIVAGQG